MVLMSLWFWSSDGQGLKPRTRIWVSADDWSWKGGLAEPGTRDALITGGDLRRSDEERLGVETGNSRWETGAAQQKGMFTLILVMELKGMKRLK